MLILGKSSDDKGTQLEALTRELLARMGCKNVEGNIVSSGGEEIDVNADYPLPSFGGDQYRRLVCECKAFARPIDMPHWLKFLGKIYSEEARLNSEISGCFIALSGVNGNVSGHYDQLRINRPNIMLVKGDTLADELKKIFKLCDVERVNEVLGKFTERRYRSVEEAYYDHNAYWVVIFEDDAFTVLDNEGSPLKGERIDILRPMIEGALPVRSYIGLEQEAEAQRRAIQAKKSILAQLIRNNGSIEVSNLAPGDIFNFTESEFREAIKELTADGWIKPSEDSPKIQFLDDSQDIFFSNLVSTYHFMLSGEPKFDLIEMLKSDFFVSHLNEKFVAQIQKIQGDLPLSHEDIQDAIKLFRWSPSALLWAVQPDPMIVTHRNLPDFKNNEQMDHFDRNYFFRQLYQSLKNDMTYHIPRRYLIDTFKIREFETKQKVRVKSSVGIELESDLHERMGIGELAEPYRGPDGSNFILMLLMENAPQPWEVAAWNFDAKKESSELNENEQKGKQ
jgi:hypothetical protein